MRVSTIYNYLSACAGDCSHMFWSGEVADSYPPAMLTVAQVGIFSSMTIAPFCHFHLFVSVNVSKSRQHPRAKSSSTAIRIRRQYTIQYVTQGFLSSNCIHLLWGKVYMTGNLCMQVVRKKNRRAARLLWYFSQRSPVFFHTQGVANIQYSHAGTLPLARGKRSFNQHSFSSCPRCIPHFHLALRPHPLPNRRYRRCCLLAPRSPRLRLPSW